MVGPPEVRAAVVAFALAAAIAAAACEEPAAARMVPAIPTSPAAGATKTFAVRGVVVDAASSANPVSGARVQIVGSVHTFSDDRGAFSLANVAAGRAFLEVTKTGYQPAEQMISIDTDLGVTVTLIPLSTASGAPAGH
jgi:hypothetical protein